MRGPQPVPPVLTARQQTILTQLTRHRTGAHHLVVRARLILLAAAGHNNTAIARQLALSARTVRLWRGRWLAATARLHAQEQADPLAAPLTTAITAALTDAPRPGAPPTFSAEQLVQVVAIACEDPQDSTRPTSHWTPREVAAEAIKRGIVPTISVRSVRRFLKR
jgi:putative transposase